MIPMSIIYSSAVETALTTKSDPEETLSLALTAPEAIVVAFALVITRRLFPELASVILPLAEKAREVGVAQGFFPEEV